MPKELRASQRRIERRRGANATANPRTRGETAVAAAMAAANLQVRVLRPPRRVGAKAIWKGGKPDFREAFRQAFWQADAVCANSKCPTPLTKLTRANGEIDHKVPWNTWLTNKCKTQRVCTGPNGRHWDVYFQRDVLAWNETKSNLQALCKHCNGSLQDKKLPRLDAFGPIAFEDCPGGCTYPRASI